jgi:tetratricopeptide (TPR) repeat protein
MIGVWALALLLLAVPAVHAQSALANCKYYTKTQEDFEQGLDYCARCILEEPENPEARYYGAWCLAEMGRWEDAYESFYWLMERRKHKDKKIRKHAKWASERVQNYFVSHFNAGVELLTAGDNPGAKEEFLIATKINPGKPEGFLNLGYTQNQLDDPEGAIASFRKAIEIAPDQAIGYDYLSVALSKRRESLLAFAEVADSMDIVETTQELETTLNKVLEFNPENDAALLELGDLAFARGDQAQGIEHYMKAIEISANNVLSLYNVGIGFYERDEYEPAAEVFALVAQTLDDPDDAVWVDAMYNLGLSQLYGKMFEGCVETVERLVDVNPDEKDYYRILATACNQIGEKEKASRYLMKYDEMLRAEEGDG